MTPAEVKEATEALYEQGWIVRERFDDPEYQDRAVALNNVALKLLTGGAYKPAEEKKDPTEPSGEPMQWQGIDLTPDASFSIPAPLRTSRPFPIVGRRFTPKGFASYLAKTGRDGFTWNPTGITVHHTAYPDLDMRPSGFTEQHMWNLRGYYVGRGWSSGPHIFTDDKGIWILTPLSRRGVHARSFNASRIGIETLGNFDNAKDFNSPRGQKALLHSKLAAALLMRYLGISRGKLNFHRHDRLTSKTCPGRLVDFPKFEADVIAIRDALG